MTELNKKQLEKIIQKFYNETLESNEYSKLIADYTTAQQNLGIHDQQTLSKIFDYLDNSLQNKLRAYMKKRETK